MSRNSKEYRALIKATGKLTKAVQDHITPISAELVANDLITTESQDALRNSQLPKIERAADLVKLINTKVEQNPANYHTFVKILDEDRATFKDVLKLLELSDDQATSGTTIVSGEQGWPKRSALPKIRELQLIQYGDKMIRVIAGSAPRWETIAARLHFEPADIGSIQKSAHFQAEDACTAVFSRWVEGQQGLRTPIAWDTVVTILKEANLGTLSEQLNSVLVG